MKSLFKTILIVTVFVILAGCKTKPEHQFSDTDVSKISAWNKFFGEEKRSRLPFDQPVCHVYADACTLKYQQVYKDPTTVVDIAKAYTSSIDFGSQNLSNWALDIAKNTNATQIKVCLGIYTPDIVTTFPTQLANKAGRLTVFLYPVDVDGKPAIYTQTSTYTPTGPNGCSAQPATSTTGDSTNPFNLAGVEP